MEEIYNELKEKSRNIPENSTAQCPQPNIITYSTLIKGFGKCGNMKRANELYEFLIENKFKVDDVLFNTLCDGYCKLKDEKNALTVLENMKKFNIPRTAVIYTSLIKMYCSMNLENKAYELFNLMKKEKLKPSIVIYTSIIQMLNRNHRIDETIAVYNDLKNDKEIKIDYLFYSFLINGCVFNKKLEKAIEILLETINLNIKLQDETYNNVLEYLLSNKFMKNHERSKHASTICKALKDKNYQIKIDLYNRLMKLMYNGPTENKKNGKNKKFYYI